MKKNSLKSMQLVPTTNAKTVNEQIAAFEEKLRNMSQSERIARVDKINDARHFSESVLRALFNHEAGDENALLTFTPIIYEAIKKLDDVNDDLHYVLQESIGKKSAA